MPGETRGCAPSRELAALIADARAFHTGSRPPPPRRPAPPATGTAFARFLSWWARHRRAQWHQS
jgi:hypothetical protein